jgi:amino acid permease
MTELKVEINFMGILILYLIAVLVTAIDKTAGIVAFICITALILTLLIIPMRQRRQ